MRFIIRAILELLKRKIEIQQLELRIELLEEVYPLNKNKIKPLEVTGAFNQDRMIEVVNKINEVIKNGN